MGVSLAGGSVFGGAVTGGADGGRAFITTVVNIRAVAINIETVVGCVAKRPNGRSLGLDNVMSDKFDATDDCLSFRLRPANGVSGREDNVFVDVRELECCGAASRRPPTSYGLFIDQSPGLFADQSYDSFVEESHPHDSSGRGARAVILISRLETE